MLAMNRQFYNKRQSLTVTCKQAGLGKLFDWSKNFPGYMFNIKLEKKSYKMSFKALPVKIQRSKNKGHNVGGTIPGADRFKIKDLWKILLILPKKLLFFLRCSYFCTSLVPSISLVDHCGIYRKNYVKINPNVYNTIKCLNWNLKTRIV